MKILVVADEREMSIEAARIIGALVRTETGCRFRASYRFDAARHVQRTRTHAS